MVGASTAPHQSRGKLPQAESRHEILAFNLGAKPCKFCSLQVKEVALGRQVSFIIPAGMSAKAILDLIEKANPRMPADCVVWSDRPLLKHAGVSKVFSKDTEFSFTICFDSHSMSKPAQDRFLAKHNLKWTKVWVQVVGAALFRDRYGFPRDRDLVGTERDKGNLFKGKMSRGSNGILWTVGHGIRAEKENSTSHNSEYSSIIATGSPKGPQRFPK